MVFDRCGGEGPQAEQRSLLRGRGGAVSSPHHLASRAGVDALRQGGTAVDAAIAANAVLAVVDPSACGLAGDAFWLIWNARERRLYGLNGSGRSGSLASLDGVPAGATHMERRGAAAVTVPGAVRSWQDAHARFGRLPTSSLLAEAVTLASEGFVASNTFASEVEWMHQSTLSVAYDAGLSALYRPGGVALRPGEKVRLPALAATLARLAEQGLDDFYHGETKDRLARFLSSSGSSIVAGDLEDHQSIWCEPISQTYRDVEVFSTPANSSGMVALDILGILDRLPAASSEEADAAPWWHRVIESVKLALADRDSVLCDPASFDRGAFERLMSAGDMARKASLITDTAKLDGAAVRALVGGTVVVCAVDAEGSMVTLIESVAGRFGALLADPATGLHLNNRGSAFALDPRHPNALAPRKRVASSLMPTMAMRNGQPWLALASMGGDSQPQLVAQLICRLVDGRQPLAEAMRAPRWYAMAEEVAAPIRRIRFERHARRDLVEQLASRGHEIEFNLDERPWTGRMQAIEIDRATNTLVAATDPRSADGAPAVVLDG